ncbi:TadE family protein [Parafrankia sp. BMG5.11]|uniref:TadE family protein n=1 Tax=Parafrankia sp. BMG5.11 TaxID=222540 RepID=UPI0010398A1B|nr:TadE family protein [Parafrankia sp. BMG5.11]TCJ32288.1 pilus assembly protein [Parafrankia sp. BMG5.11]
MRWPIENLIDCTKGTSVIETALVLPVLATLALGTFEVGTMVQKQQELQSAASEAEAIVMAAAAGPGVDSTKMKDMLANSTGFPKTDITLSAKYRCNNSDVLVDNASSCASGQRAYQFVQATFKAKYQPMWTNFGLGSAFDYVVTRTVQVG